LALTAQEKAKVVEEYRRDEKDTGSSEVQIAILTANINTLQGHFQTHKGDDHSRRGMRKMVARRRKLLDYLKRTSPASYSELIKRLGLRR